MSAVSVSEARPGGGSTFSRSGANWDGAFNDNERPKGLLCDRGGFRVSSSADKLCAAYSPGAFRFAVALRGRIRGLGREDAQALMEAAHQICPYSNATRGNVDVDLVADA